MKKILLIGFMFWSFASMAQRQVVYSGDNSTNKDGDITSVSDDRIVLGGTLIRQTTIDISPFIYRWYNDDSAKMRVSGVILKGREADCVADIIRMNPSDFPILDSVIKVLYVVKPANGDDVTFNSIPNKEWMRIFKRVKNDPVLIIKNAFKNIMDELLLHGGSFIIHRINLEVVQSDDEFNAKKKSGQDYAQKKDEGGY